MLLASAHAGDVQLWIVSSTVQCITGECSIVTWITRAWHDIQPELYMGNNNCQFWKPFFKTFRMWTVNWFMRQVRRMSVLHSMYQIFLVILKWPLCREGEAKQSYYRSFTLYATSLPLLRCRDFKVCSILLPILLRLVTDSINSDALQLVCNYEKSI
jgi:hypothetical protein